MAVPGAARQSAPTAPLEMAGPLPYLWHAAGWSRGLMETKMRHLSGDVNAITFAVHKWKPITPEQFAAELHRHVGEMCDGNGHGGTSTGSWRLDSHCHGTIHYHKTDPRSPVSTPFAMTMNTRSGKVLCFGYIGDGGDGVPEPE